MSTRRIQDVYPLSPLQEGMLFHSLYAPESGVYVEQLSCELLGPLDVAAFERAWGRVIERHAILRTAWVYGTYGNNFLKTMMRLAAERDRLRVVGDQRGCPTATADIAEAILAIDAAMARSSPASVNGLRRT